jgi:hypothetical protein
MFGGNILEISGPCFFENDTIKLVLGDLSHPYSIGECYRVSKIKAKCEIPPLTARGRILVGVSLSGGASVSYTTRITVGKSTCIIYDILYRPTDQTFTLMDTIPYSSSNPDLPLR